MNVRAERGVALVLALMVILLLSALGLALVVTTSTEGLIAANYRSGQEGLYAADAAVERALNDLPGVADWNALLDGSTPSAFVDGAPNGVRTLADGSTIDLTRILSTANCGKATPCSPADLVANLTGGRPWGANNPVWHFYAYGNLADLLPTASVDSPFYVAVLVGDDPSETDGDPLHDGVDPASNPGAGVLALRAEAFGPRGTHKVIELTVARADTPAAGVRVLSWRAVR
jgi:hypothetical protein